MRPEEIGIMLILIGILIVMLATFLLLILGMRSAKKIGGGAVVFLGPIPLGFATDKETLKWLVILGLVMLVASLFLVWVLAGQPPRV